MSHTFPRLLGALAIVYGVSLLAAVGTTAGSSVWFGVGPFLLAWFSASATLAHGRVRSRRPAVVLVVLLVLLGCALPTLHFREPETLLLWMLIILAATDRPKEQALLLRACVTCVYAFSALAKSQPTFLAGDDLLLLVHMRPHLSFAEGLIASELGPVLAAVTVLVEGAMAVVLWFDRTRTIGIALGVGLHATLVLVATIDWHSVAPLVVLNGLLVVGYLAFADETCRRDRRPTGPELQVPAARTACLPSLATSGAGLRGASQMDYGAFGRAVSDQPQPNRAYKVGRRAGGSM